MSDKTTEETKSNLSNKNKVILALVVLGLFGGGWFAYDDYQQNEEAKRQIEEHYNKMSPKEKEHWRVNNEAMKKAGW